ncbi:CS1 type fimbrial major subunit [Burkholderia sp. 3C]
MGVAIGAAVLLLGTMSAAQAEVVQRNITLTAQISDSMFVSKPDGSTWYGTEELEAADYSQAKFSKTLPIRVWTKNKDFNISLAQPLKMTSGRYEMANAVVTLSSNAGDNEIKFGTQQKITQTAAGNGGFDEVHDLTITANAPEKVGDASTNGSYSGDLVMLFEPVASAEPSE